MTRTPNAWWRKPRGVPPEGLFIAAICAAAYLLCSLAEPPRPAVTASIAGAPFPVCADAAQPCRRAQ